MPDIDWALTWQGVSGGVKAAQAGHDVIMTPTSHCYIDYRQSLKCARPHCRVCHPVAPGTASCSWPCKTNAVASLPENGLILLGLVSLLLWRLKAAAARLGPP